MSKARKTANETPLELAEATLRTLERKRDKVVARREQDDQELATISYQALAGGDKDATAALDDIKARILQREVDLRTLDAAIVTAKAKIEEAKAEERDEAERQAATELLGLCNVLRNAGEQADDALAVLGEAADTMRNTITAINHFGIGNPSVTQLMSLGERALRTSLRDHPWARAFEDIAPTERRNFASFITAWADTLEKQVQAKLNTREGSGKAA